MASLNRATLIGNVGKDPEVRYLETPEHPKVAQFTLATAERYKAKDGSAREQTEWHNIVAWRGLADIAEKYIRRGSQIYVEGRIRTRSWESGGQKSYRTEIVADGIQLLGGRPDGAQQRPAQQQWTTPPGQAERPQQRTDISAPVPPEAYGASDDLPF